MAKWAFWMLAVTGGGVIVTGVGIFYLAQTLAEARKSSDAAMIMAQAMIDVEAPILHARYMGLDLTSVDGPITAGEPYAGIVIDDVPGRYSVLDDVPLRNYGRTAAFLTSISLGCSVCNQLAPEPNFTHSAELGAESIVMPEPREDAHEIDVTFNIQLSDQEIQLLTDKQAHLWVFCSIKYRDFMKRPHEDRFCWRWAQRPDGEGAYFFASDGDPPSAYTIRI